MTHPFAVEASGAKTFMTNLASTPDRADVIHSVPHICFVKGTDDVDFLQARHAAMREHQFFRGMRLTTDRSYTTGHHW